LAAWARSSTSRRKRREAEQPQLWNAISADSVRAHLQQLQDIANNSSGTRAAGTIGFNRSVEYVVSQLEATGYYDVQVQYFAPQVYRIQPSSLSVVEPLPVALVQGTQFEVVRNSLVGNVTAALAGVAAFGCNASDYSAANGGAIAVVERQVTGTPGQCDVATVAAAAKTAGAVGVVFVANPLPSLRVTFDGGNGVQSAIPLVVVARAMNQTFTAPNVTVSIATNALYEPIFTMNVIANAKSSGAGSADNRTIVIGSHLDSVPAGPGINDNGSGSMSNLAVALAAASLNLTYSTRVRHCWWGAEELGLLGSTAYVKSLNASELDSILLNLNFDMLGSPNGVLYIDKINPNSTTVPEPVKVASLHIEDLFQMFFETVINKPWVPTTIDNPGRSDYAAFLAANIPAGGLATGAEEEKSVAQQAVFGGLQGAQMDPCYHEACDTIDNIDWTYLFDNVRALAFTVQHLGEQANATAWLYSNDTLPNATTVDESLNVADMRAFEHALFAHAQQPSDE
jgi:Zn-dependent M28 family amino/carboxypeptidase